MSEANKEQGIQPEYVAQMNAIASTLDEVFNGDLKGEKRINGFALLVFPFGEHDNARVNYISNTNREDMLCAMKEFIARNEGRAADTKTKQ